MSRCAVLAGIVEGIDFAERAEASLEIVYDGARKKRLGTIQRYAWTPVNVVVYEGLILIRVGEIRFLPHARLAVEVSAGRRTNVRGNFIPGYSRSEWQRSCSIGQAAA